MRWEIGRGLEGRKGRIGVVSGRKSVETEVITDKAS